MSTYLKSVTSVNWTIRKEQRIFRAWYVANKDNDLSEELCEIDTILSALKTAVNNLNGTLAVDVCTAAVELSGVWRRVEWYMVTKVWMQFVAPSTSSIFYHPEDGGGKFLRSVGTYIAMESA